MAGVQIDIFRVYVDTIQPAPVMVDTESLQLRWVMTYWRVE